MKTTLFVECDSNEKIELLIEMARAMGLTITDEKEQHQASEPAESYSGNSRNLKAAFIAEASSKQKMDMLLKVAVEMGIRLSPVSEEALEDLLLAEKSLREEWLSPENEHWDEFLRTHKIE